jgi:hypothetical protein
MMEARIQENPSARSLASAKLMAESVGKEYDLVECLMSDFNLSIAWFPNWISIYTDQSMPRTTKEPRMARTTKSINYNKQSQEQEVTEQTQ